MNNESPLIPKGSLLEQKNKGRRRFKIYVLAVLGVHGVALLALLMAGCNRNTDSTGSPSGSNTTAESSRSEAVSPVVSNPLPTLDSSNTPAAPENTNTGLTSAAPPTGPASGMTTGAPAGTGTVPLPAVTPAGPGTAPVSTGAATDYKVVKHDTLAKIAKRSHVTLAALSAANPGVDSSKLKIDQVIHIPAPTAPTSAGTATPTPGTPAADTAAGEQVYTVKSGDSLIKIAHDFGVSVKALRAANALKTDRIRVDQKLKIPAKTATTAASGAGGASAPVTGAGGSGPATASPSGR